MSASLRLLLKFFISFGLLWWITRDLDLAAVGDALLGVSPLLLLPAVLFVTVLGAIQAVRWRHALEVFEASLELGYTIRVMMLSLLFNQALPSTIGGDLIRIRYACKESIGWKVAAGSVVIDRLAGLWAMLMFSVVALFGLWSLTKGGGVFWSAALLVATGLGAIVLFLSAGIFPKSLRQMPLLRQWDTLCRGSWSLLHKRKALLEVTSISLFVQLGVLFSLAYVGWILNAEIGYVAIFSIYPVVLLISMVPISIGGWGLREGAMVVGLGLVGVSAEMALAVSVLFGFVMLASGLLGGGIWIATQRR